MGFNASPACPYDKSGVKIMVRTEHFQCDNDREKQTYSDKIPSTCHFFHHKAKTDLPGIQPMSQRLKPEIYPHSSLYENTFRISRRTHCLYIINTNPSILCREIIAVCYDNHTKHIEKPCGQYADLLKRKRHVLSVRCTAPRNQKCHTSVSTRRTNVKIVLQLFYEVLMKVNLIKPQLKLKCCHYSLL